jgi:hypothetical protein
VNRLNHRGSEAMTPAHWVEAGTNTSAGTESAPALEIRIGKSAVFVPPGFDVITFAQVCGILTKLC